METIVERIDRLCEEKGITGAQLCRTLALSRSSLTELRKGRVATPNAENARKFAEYFGVSLEYLLGGEAAASGSAPSATDAIGYALFHETQKLTEENKEKLLEMARFFIEQQEKKQGQMK